MRTWSFANLATGKFVGKVFMGPESALLDNTPPGTIAVAGRFDPAREMVDFESGAIVQQPSESREDKQARVSRILAQQRIDELERSQLRPVREMLLNPANQDALTKLMEIDAEIANQRKLLDTI